MKAVYLKAPFQLEVKNVEVRAIGCFCLFPRKWGISKLSEKFFKILLN